MSYSGIRRKLYYTGFALFCASSSAWADCSETEESRATALAELSRQGEDAMERTALIMQALSLCKHYQWWMELGKLQSAQSYWHEAADAYIRARDMSLKNSRDPNAFIEIARANLALSDALYRLDQRPEALVAVDEARFFYDAADEAYPEKFYVQQGILDDYYATADASVLSRTMRMQLSRGIGLRAKSKKNTGMIGKVETFDNSINDAAEPPAASVSRISLQVYFESGLADLNTKNNQIVKRMADSLQQASISSSDEVQIVGHTDSVGDHAYNQDLSIRRSESVRRELKSILGAGIPLVSIGRGESELRYPEHDAEARRRNRRVELVIRRY